MSTKLLAAAMFTLLAMACNKDKFTTEPQVEIISISPEVVVSGNIITIEARYTDDEGDLDSVIVVYKWYNGNTVTRTDTLDYYSIGDIGIPAKTREADLFVKYEYNTFNTGMISLSGVSKDTTATFGLILLDKEKHRSNYDESSPIRLKKP